MHSEAGDEAWRSGSDERFCPFVARPMGECHCAHRDSRRTEATLLFCLNEYRRCGLYLRAVREGGGQR